jgi:predicted nucleotidyltransferase
MATTNSVPLPTLEEVVRRIVRTVQPKRIILFGSAARGEMKANSDLDLLVVTPDGVSRREAGKRIDRSLLRLGVPTDVVVVTESDVEQFANEDSFVISLALREGMEIYRAA